MYSDDEAERPQNAAPNTGQRFVWFEGSTRGGRAFPTCSVTKSGSMTINRVAIEAVGDPPALRVGYSEERQQIALRPALRDEAGAIQLRRSVRADGTETGSSSIFARSFLSYHGVQLDENNTFRLDEVGDGVFVLSLDDPLPKSRATRKGTNQ